MFCENCGKEMSGEGNFCVFCGAGKSGANHNNQVVVNTTGMQDGNYAPPGDIFMVLKAKMGDSWKCIVSAFACALFALFPFCKIESYSVSVFSYFDLFKEVKEVAKEYWSVDIDFWVVLIIILNIVAIYYCYKVLTCIMNERYKIYIENYSKSASICIVAAAVVSFIFSMRINAMCDAAWGDRMNICSCTIWVWAFAAISLVNIFVFCKKRQVQSMQPGSFHRNNTLAQMAYEKEKNNMQTNNTWVCKKCGFVNPNYAGTCSCGNSKYNN